MGQLVQIVNGKAVTDSLIVAEVFGKDHRNVLADIENQIEKLNDAGESEWGVLNFQQTQYQHPQNQQWYKKFELTEDAFALVAMSYVTPKAMKMKVKFLAEFKRMRAILSGQAPVADPQPRNEFQQVDRLTQVLKVGTRERLFNEATEHAIRLQLAESILGCQIVIQSPEPEPEVRPLSDLAPKRSARSERPQWVRDGYGAKAIGFLAGVSATKVGMVAVKHGLQTDEYGGWYEYIRSGREFKIFVYNEQGKDELLRLLKDGR